MDLSDLNVLKQEPNGGSAFTESKSLNNLQQLASPPPPIPPRQSANTSGFSSNSNYLYQNPAGYGAFNSNPYSSNLYSSYGLTPFGHQTTGYGAMNNNSFMRAAEENSRSAFQSIESVVQAFSAVSAMFESTYYAVYNSFRAVVGVADQFYRLKTHLSGIISALAILRTLKYVLKKLLRLLGLKRYLNNDNVNSDETLWSQISGASKILTESEQFIKMNSTNRSQTNWPLIMFLGVVLGGPYLLWKVLNSVESMQKDDSLWMSGKIDHFIAAAEHDFDSVNNDELSFRRGQRIIIAPKEYQPKMRGWLLATVDGKQVGIVPANYIKIMGKKIGENTAKVEQS